MESVSPHSSGLRAGGRRLPEAARRGEDEGARLLPRPGRALGRVTSGACPGHVRDTSAPCPIGTGSSSSSGRRDRSRGPGRPLVAPRLFTTRSREQALSRSRGPFSGPSLDPSLALVLTLLWPFSDPARPLPGAAEPLSDDDASQGRRPHDPLLPRHPRDGLGAGGGAPTRRASRGLLSQPSRATRCGRCTSLATLQTTFSPT